MVNFILLDTNIYRQLGIKFYSHIDYVSLKNYAYASGSELRISEVVYSEFYSKFIEANINKPINDIKTAISKLKDFRPFSNLDINIKEEDEISVKEFLKERLTEDFRMISPKYILTTELIDFLIKNKQEIKKDNTRDYLIWLSLIELAQNYPSDQIVLISNDKIFEENQYFHEFQKRYKIKNIRIFPSIASFLSEYSFKVDFLSNELILRKIPKAVIEDELKKDISSLPSNMSYFYYHEHREFGVEHFEILGYKVEEFYTFKDLDSGKSKFILHLKVPIKVIFEPEKKIAALKLYLSNIDKDYFYAETFDPEGRPIYNEDVLFLFEGELDIEKQDIIKLDFLDFFPDNYKYEKIRHHFATTIK